MSYLILAYAFAVLLLGSFFLISVAQLPRR